MLSLESVETFCYSLIQLTIFLISRDLAIFYNVCHLLFSWTPYLFFTLSLVVNSPKSISLVLCSYLKLYSMNLHHFDIAIQHLFPYLQIYMHNRVMFGRSIDRGQYFTITIWQYRRSTSFFYFFQYTPLISIKNVPQNVR